MQLKNLVAELAPLLGEILKDKKTVAEIVGNYLALIGEDVCPRSYETKQDLLGKFAADFGNQAVGDLSAFTLKKWIADHPQWKSSWTKKRVAICINACFSWAVKMGLLRSNPFKAVRFDEGEAYRPMTDGEFQSLLKNSSPQHRRFLFALRWTGARPSELSALSWSNIDWEKQIAVLHRHKTAKKTRKPRIIYLTNRAVRLLDWIRRQAGKRDGNCTGWLRQLLSPGPVPRAEVNRLARRRGYRYTQLDWARYALAVIVIKKGRGKHQRDHYALPETPPTNPPITREPKGSDHIFLDTRGNRLHRNSLSSWLFRVRKRAGLSMDCKLYGLRHRFGETAVREGLNLLVIAELLGHSSTDVTARYCHVADNVGHLIDQLEKVGKTPRP